MLDDECHVTRVNQGLFLTTMEAEKRDPGNEVVHLPVQKSAIQCKLQINILDYDWLINNRLWSGLMKSFVFKSSVRPGWRNLWREFYLIS